MNWRSLLCILTIASLIVFAIPAAADETEPPPAEPDVSDYSDSGFGMDLSAYGLIGFAWNPGIGMGIQFGYPIVPNGFIPNPKYRDALHIEGGFDIAYYWWTYGPVNIHQTYFNPLVGVRYTVYVLETFAPFATVKLGAAAPVAEKGVNDSVAFFVSGTVGFLWDFAAHWSLRGELGWQYHGHNSDVYRIGVTYRF